jgi:hypothetical protein
MKTIWISVCLLALLSLPALAANQKSKNLTLDQTVQVAGKQLKPGSYKLKWDDTNSANTTVSFTKGKDVIATVPAEIKHEKNTDNATMEVNTAGGTNKLERVYSNNEVLDFSRASSPGM